MSLIIVYTRADGGTSVVHPASKEDLERVLGELTQEEYVSHILSRSVPSDALNVVQMDSHELPSDRVFRNAWKLENDLVVEDMEASKQIKLNQFREMRKPLLARLDLEFMKAMESGADLSGITEKKQSLRDVTKQVLPENIEELKTFVPDILIEN